MNIIQFDETIDMETLYEIHKMIKENYPNLEFIAVPKGIDFMTDVNAEQLFDIVDKLSIALAKIKEERPEEYHRAYKERISSREISPSLFASTPRLMSAFLSLKSSSSLFYYSL